MNILEMATTACNNDLVNSDEGCNLAPPPLKRKGKWGMRNDDTGKQAGSYLDKPGNQGPTGSFFFQYLAGLGRLSKKLGSRRVQVTRYN